MTIDLRNEHLSANISRFHMYVKEKDHDISGLLINDHYHFFIEFFGTRQMLHYLDGLFDYVNFPMAATEQRTFGEEGPKTRREDDSPPVYLKPVPEDFSEEREPDFILHVQFRQGSTWQGTISRVASGQTRRFRSELELLMLVLNAIGFSSEEKGEL